MRFFVMFKKFKLRILCDYIAGQKILMEKSLFNFLMLNVKNSASHQNAVTSLYAFIFKNSS